MAGPREVVQRLRATPSYVGTTPLPPALAEAARAALRLIERGQLRARLGEHVAHCRAALELEPAEALSPVVALSARSPAAGRALHAALLEAGLLVPFVHYPGGPAGGEAGWLRVALSAAHSDADLERLIAALLERRELLA